MDREEFDRWAEANGLGEKLRVAVENHVIGRGWSPFNGLERGEATVKVVYNGVAVRFEPSDVEERLAAKEEVKNLIIGAVERRAEEAERERDELKEKLRRRRKEEPTI